MASAPIHAFQEFFSRVLFTSTHYNIPSKPLAAFPLNHCWNNELWQRPPVLKSCMLLTELWGSAYLRLLTGYSWDVLCTKDWACYISDWCIILGFILYLCVIIPINVTDSLTEVYPVLMANLNYLQYTVEKLYLFSATWIYKRLGMLHVHIWLVHNFGWISFGIHL